jgi:DNA polymerase bacteriophage-type
MRRPKLSDAVVVDFETHADPRGGYSLARMSTRAYLQDPRFEILSVAIACGEDDAILFYYKHGTDGASLADASAFLEEAASTGKILVSHNIDFDGLLLALQWGIRFQRTFDTVGWLRYRGYGWSLANGARAVGLFKDEAPIFSETSLLDPSRLEEFMAYNCKDVEIARALFQAAIDDRHFTVLEFWASEVTSRENLRGIRIDLARASDLAAHFARNRDKALDAICRRFQEFDTSRLRSSQAVRDFLKRSFSVDLGKLDKRDSAVTVVKTSDTPAGEFLRLREAFDTWDRHSKKIAALAVGPERIYGQLHYHGAHTGRFTGGGTNAERMNLQNLHKGRDDDFEDLGLIRSVIVADEDESFVSSDLSTIEPRVLAFLAGQQDQLERFANGEDIYVYFISDVFPGVSIVKGGENDHLRQLGKQAVLGLGYGQGKRGFAQKLKTEDPTIDPELAARIHDGYHRKFARISSLRREYFRAFRNAVDTGLATQVGHCSFRRIVDAACEGVTIEVMLPTERLLTYRSVRKTREMTPFGKVDSVYRFSDDYQFDPKQKGGRGSTGKKVKGGDGRLRAQLLSQTLIENIVSAVARDVIVGQMVEIEKARLPVKFTVHDEAVVATKRCVCSRRNDPIGRGRRVEDNHEPDCAWVRGRAIVKDVMSRVPRFFEKIAGLPVACELSDSIRDCYGK